VILGRKFIKIIADSLLLCQIADLKIENISYEKPFYPLLFCAIDLKHGYFP
jgi:hypothetical protein